MLPFFFTLMFTMLPVTSIAQNASTQTMMANSAIITTSTETTATQNNASYVQYQVSNSSRKEQSNQVLVIYHPNDHPHWSVLCMFFGMVALVFMLDARAVNEHAKAKMAQN